MLSGWDANCYLFIYLLGGVLLSGENVSPAPPTPPFFNKINMGDISFSMWLQSLLCMLTSSIQVVLVSDNFVGQRRHLLDTMPHFRNRLQIQRLFPFKPLNSTNKNAANPLPSFPYKSFSVTHIFYRRGSVSHRCPFPVQILTPACHLWLNLVTYTEI